MKILVTGSAGFIGGYLVEDLLQADHEVVGLDNFSKYGPLKQASLEHPRYRFVQGDAKDVGLLGELLQGVDQVVAGPARPTASRSSPPSITRRVPGNSTSFLTRSSAPSTASASASGARRARRKC